MKPSLYRTKPASTAGARVIAPVSITPASKTLTCAVPAVVARLSEPEIVYTWPGTNPVTVCDTPKLAATPLNVITSDCVPIAKSVGSNATPVPAPNVAQPVPGAAPISKLALAMKFVGSAACTTRIGTTIASATSASPLTQVSASDGSTT